MTTGCIDIDWKCKHRKKVRSIYASISTNSCTESSKTQFSLWVSLNILISGTKKNASGVSMLGDTYKISKNTWSGNLAVWCYLFPPVGLPYLEWKTFTSKFLKCL